MQYKRLCLLAALFMVVALHAQEDQDYHWRLEFDYFFDNREYAPSSFIDPQTMNGIWLNPVGGVTWETSHTLYAGVNMLKIPGMKRGLDKVDLTLYYQYDTDRLLFRAGAFPRDEVLTNYSDFFFSDSVNNFVPLMQGLFWQMGSERSHLNAWMDWTGYATPEARESFFVGFSGRAAGGLFFGDFQSYLYHYAGTHPGNPAYGVSEQMQVMASLGMEQHGVNSLRWLLSAGIFAGVERDRRAERSYNPVGFAARGEIEYWGIGTQNRLYVGDPRMRFYRSHGGDLYWGTPFLRGSSYLQSKWYIRLLETGSVAARLNSNLHLSEGEVMFQQTLTVTATLDPFSGEERKGVHYPWLRIFQ